MIAGARVARRETNRPRRNEARRGLLNPASRILDPVTSTPSPAPVFNLTILGEIFGVRSGRKIWALHPGADLGGRRRVRPAGARISAAPSACRLSNRQASWGPGVGLVTPCCRRAHRGLRRDRTAHRPSPALQRLRIVRRPAPIGQGMMAHGTVHLAGTPGPRATRPGRLRRSAQRRDWAFAPTACRPAKTQ